VAGFKAGAGVIESFFRSFAGHCIVCIIAYRNSGLCRQSTSHR
jgi:hypothetical protein